MTSGDFDYQDVIAAGTQWWSIRLVTGEVLKVLAAGSTLVEGERTFSLWLTNKTLLPVLRIRDDDIDDMESFAEPLEIEGRFPLETRAHEGGV